MKRLAPTTIRQALASSWPALREWIIRWLAAVDPHHPAIQLGGFTLIALSFLALLQAWSAERIAANERAALRHSLQAVLPAGGFDNDPLADAVTLQDDRLGVREPVTVYRARQRGQPVAIVLPAVAPEGYSGPIRLLVGIGRDGRLTGVEVLEHRETPGLGDRIEREKSGWLLRFTGRSLEDPPASRWRVRRDGGDFDQFTGATITPRAVVKAVGQALEVFRDRRAVLLPAVQAGVE